MTTEQVLKEILKGMFEGCKTKEQVYNKSFRLYDIVMDVAVEMGAALEPMTKTDLKDFAEEMALKPGPMPEEKPKPEQIDDEYEQLRMV